MNGIKFAVRANDLPRMDSCIFGGRIDAYFVIQNHRGLILYQSEYVKNDCTPVFKTAIFANEKIDSNEMLTFKWYDFDRFGPFNKCFGEFHVNLEELKSNGGLLKEVKNA